MNKMIWAGAWLAIAVVPHAEAALVRVDFQGAVSALENAGAVPGAISVGSQVTGFYFYDDSLAADVVSPDEAFYYGDASKIGMQFTINGTSFLSQPSAQVFGVDQFVQVVNDSLVDASLVDEFRLYSFAQSPFNNGSSIDALSIQYTGPVSSFNSLALPISAMLGVGRAEGLDASANPYLVEFSIQSASVNAVPLPPAVGLMAAGLLMLSRRMRRSI